MKPEMEKQETGLRIAAIIRVVLALIVGFYIWSVNTDKPANSVVQTTQVGPPTP